jgi:SAM-dependent methyltransferase
VHEFDAAATERFFNGAFAEFGRELTATGEPKLRHRDQIFLRYLLEPVRRSNPRILDFGCGHGNLLVHLLALGYDAIGMDKHVGMRTFAEAAAAELNAQDRIMAGGVRELTKLPDQSFDVIIFMGVLQYLSDDDYHTALSEIPRLLRPRGFAAVTFQNALFDLFTFNKYTVDCFMHRLVGPLLNPNERAGVEEALSALVSHPQKPEYSPSRARDNVFVRLTNPLTIERDMRQYKIALVTKYFYEWFGLPPLIAGKCGDVSHRIAEYFEIEHATDWQGHFMANAFLAHIIPTYQLPPPPRMF